MANQSSARIKGDDYQHLISWLHILSLKKPNTKVTKVCIEDPLGGLVDDVTVHQGAEAQIHFHQIKYHVDFRESYSIEKMFEKKPGSSSLMDKIWKTWQGLTKEHGKEKVVLNIVSNWLIDPSDKILHLIDGENGALGKAFYEATSKSDIGIERTAWQNRLTTNESGFLEFTKSLRFHLGKDCSEAFRERVSERMEHLGLKSDETALLIAVGIVRDWIKSQTQEITLDILNVVLQNNDLYLPGTEEKGVAVYFTTIKDHRFDVPPDYIVDWRSYFEQVGGKGDHKLVNPDDWNAKLLPELISQEKLINDNTGAHLIRARGFARLSPWFAFGFTFSEVSGYKIEVNQNDKLWRTDVPANADFQLESENGEGEKYSSETRTVAVGISLTGSLTEDVGKFLNGKDVDALLLLKPKNGPGRDCLKDAGDTVAFASSAKKLIRDFVKRNNAERLLLFYFGPLSGACFLGHQLNAVCTEIQIMENSGNSYIPSFLLK